MPGKGQKNTFAAGWEAARQELLNSPEYSGQTTTLQGTVKSVQGNKITFEASPVTPLDSESLNMRTAVITDDTMVTLMKMKSMEEYEKDRQEAEGEMERLEQQINDIEDDMRACDEEMMEGGEESAECQSIREEYGQLQKSMDDLYNKMERYETVKDADLSQISSGYSITVMSKVKGGAEGEAEDPAMMGGNMEDITDKKEFEVSSVRVREVSENDDMMMP